MKKHLPYMQEEEALQHKVTLSEGVLRHEEEVVQHDQFFTAVYLQTNAFRNTTQQKLNESK